jgi:hypothetical protein
MMQQPKPPPFANRTLFDVFGSVPQIGLEGFRRRSRRGGVGSSGASSAERRQHHSPGSEQMTETNTLAAIAKRTRALKRARRIQPSKEASDIRPSCGVP